MSLPSVFRSAAGVTLACASFMIACRDAAPSVNTQTTSSAARAATAASIADSVARARQDSINRTLPGYVVDSILPVEEALRRFRLVVGGTPVTTFRHASHSRDELVARFLRAVIARDSTALREMVIDAREFADIIYPESPNMRPPYRQDPALVWRTIQNPSASGLKRLVRRAGGIPVRLADYQCQPTPERQGRNRFWRDCQLVLIGPRGDSSTHRFFGSIVERDGQFKFMSYRNEF